MNLFLTGATGFVGRHLLRRLEASRFETVYCLVRDPERLRPLVAGLPGAARIRPVSGTLESPETYEEELRDCGVVCHLAALTGKAPRERHHRVNAEGTRILVEACQRTGRPRFVHVSTIAVKFPYKKYYPYAQAKELAEIAVLQSGLDHAIVRPTLVLGPGSPIGVNLCALAGLPVTPVFGDGRTRIQPVDVDDVAACLASLVERETLGGEVFGLGGADVVTFDAFLGGLHRALRGDEPRLLHLPIGLIIGALGRIERAFGPFLPVAAGQFYAFAYDSDTVPHPLAAGVVPGRKGVGALIADLAAGAGQAAPPVAASAAAASAAPPAGSDLAGGNGDDWPEPAPPPRATPSQLDRECTALCRYLIGEKPSAYVRAKYRAAHEPGCAGPVRAPGTFDDVLIAFARRGAFAARLADAWASLLSRNGDFRRKLVLLLAILESTAPTHRTVDHADAGSPAGFVAGAALRTLGWGLSFATALLLLGPRRLLWRPPARADGRGRGAR